jgi:SPP1 gp7 family putative phage head morphogenesis protein
MRSLTRDDRDRRQKKTLKGKFKPSAQAERQFLRSLKKVARASAHIVEQHLDVDGVGLIDTPEMLRALEQYAKKLTPWAQAQAAKLIQEVQKANKRAYNAKSKAIGEAIRVESDESFVLQLARDLVDEQVALIKSIPLEAGRRAQEIAFKNVLTGTRAAPDSDTVAELQRQQGMTEEVAVNRATLIARTETARSNAAINQARAMSVGSNQYRWHNSGDAAVRHSHKFLKGKRLQGMIFSWDKPPTLDDGMTGHPGTFPNCRCFAEPVFDTE